MLLAARFLRPTSLFAKCLRQSVRDHRLTAADDMPDSEIRTKMLAYVFTLVGNGPNTVRNYLPGQDGISEATDPARRIFMLTKRRAAQILTTAFIGAAISFLTALGPGSNLAVGNSPATSLAAASTNSLVSLQTYYDA